MTDTTSDYAALATQYGAESLHAGDAGALLRPSCAANLVVRTLRELLNRPELLRPPEPVIPHLAWKGRVTLLAAREKSGKSTLAGVAASALSSGSNFAGEPLERGRVLWVALEEHLGDAVQRFLRWQANPDAVGLIDQLPEALDSLTEAVVLVEPDLVTIDTLPALVEGLVHDAGSSSQWTTIMQSVTRLARDSNAAVLLLHHSRRSDNAYRDSSAIGAGVDAVIEMAEVPDDPTARSFKPRARWEAKPFTLRLTDTGYVLSGGSVSTETLTLFYVQEHPGCSKRAVRDGVQRKAAEVDANLDRLVRQGLVEGRGVGSGHQYFPARSSCPEGAP